MINVDTLAPHYPSPSLLTATQLISLHLHLHRPLRDGDSLDPFFGPYISVLPRDFESHPVTWLVEGRWDGVGTELLESLPPSAMLALRLVCRKFWDDWAVVRHYMQRHPCVIQKSTRTELKTVDRNSVDSNSDFLWAWLNVNTRCIYYRLSASRSDPDNLTMCPILDFANHTNTSRHMSPVPTDPRPWNTPSSSKQMGDCTFLSPRDVVQGGEEIYLCYGAHANRTLFVEYGFINELPEAAAMSEEYNGEVDVQDIIEQLYEDKGALGTWMKSILEDNGYWGDWTLHSSPSPAYPSFRLIAALRLYHVNFRPAASTMVREQDLEPWRDTLLGQRNIVSEENETSWRETLIQICEILIRRAETGICGLAELNVDLRNVSWFMWMQDNIRALWQEEAFVAAAVAKSVQQGVQF